MTQGKGDFELLRRQGRKIAQMLVKFDVEESAENSFTPIFTPICAGPLLLRGPKVKF